MYEEKSQGGKTQPWGAPVLCHVVVHVHVHHCIEELDGIYDAEGRAETNEQKAGIGVKVLQVLQYVVKTRVDGIL